MLLWNVGELVHEALPIDFVENAPRIIIPEIAKRNKSKVLSFCRAMCFYIYLMKIKYNQRPKSLSLQ